MKPTVRDQIHRRSGGHCEAAVAGVCTQRTQHIHHRKLRSQGGADTPQNLIGVCLACHTWIHANVAQAKDLELLVSPWVQQ